MGIDHLVTSMYTVVSSCWKGVFIMPSAFSWQNSEGGSEMSMKGRKAPTSVAVHKWNSKHSVSIFMWDSYLMPRCVLSLYTVGAALWQQQPWFRSGLRQGSVYSLSCHLPVFFFLVWLIVDLQYGICFRCTTKWFSYTHIYIYFWFRLFFLIEFYKILSTGPWLYTRCLLVFCFYIGVVCIC